MNYGDQVAPCRARRVEPVDPVELVVSSESSCAVRLARHSQNAWARHVECVESSRAKWNLSLTLCLFNKLRLCPALWHVNSAGFGRHIVSLPFSASPLIRAT